MLFTRISAIRTMMKATNTWAANRLMGEVPIISSFTPTKNRTKTVASIYLKSFKADFVTSSSSAFLR